MDAQVQVRILSKPCYEQEEEFRTMYEAITQTGAAVNSANLPDFPILRTLKEPLLTRGGRNPERGSGE
jgi:hypothetical protein